MTELLKKIRDVGFVPLLVLEDAEDAVPFAKALAAGGVPIAEVTFRTEAAAEVIRRIAAEVPEVLVGAGTVHSTAQAQQAVQAGAQFIVTPGFNPQVVRWCLDNGVAIVPGTVSPADLEQALGFGLEVCKFFPAEAYGGIQTLKSLAGPYAGLKFMPTGGVSPENMNDYMALGNVLAVGGSFMAPDKLVKAKAWDEIAALCRKTVQDHLGFELLHIGINTESEAQGKQVAGQLAALFGLPITETPGAYFAGGMAEVMKGKGRGQMGHIGIATNDLPRAVAYFEAQGVQFDHSTDTFDPTGRLTLVYFAQEVGGFALHLRAK